MLNYRKALLILATIVSAGCGMSSGDPGAAPGVTVRIENGTAVPLSAVRVSGASGEPLLSTAFNCQPGAACLLSIPAGGSQSLGFQFVDSTGRLAAALPTSDPSRSGFTLRAEPATLGQHLFNQLLQFGPFGETTLANAIDRHIYSEHPSGDKPQILDDLAQHYASYMAQAGSSEAGFYEAVFRALVGDDPDTADYLASLIARLSTIPAAGVTIAQPLKAAHTAGSGSNAGSGASGTCPVSVPALAGIVSGDSSIALMSRNPVLTAIVGITGQLVAGACVESTTQGMPTQALSKLDAIRTQLDQVEARLAMAGIQTNAVLAQAAFANFQSNYAQFNDELTRLRSVVSVYKALLRSDRISYKPEPFPDLGSYINSLQGGFNRDSYSRNSSLQSLLGGIQSTRDSFSRLVEASRVSQMSASLQTLCGNAQNIYGDIIAIRTQCNMLVDKVIRDASAVMVELSAILTDAMAAIDAQYLTAQAKGDTAQLEWLRSTLSNTEDPGQPWSFSRHTIVNKMLVSLDALTQQMMASVTAPTAGLSDKLLKGLEAARCTRTFGGQTVPGIENWYINDAQTRAPVTPSPYLVTECHAERNSRQGWFARFHYNTDADTDGKVMTMLGVPVQPDAMTRAVDRSEGNSGRLSSGACADAETPNWDCNWTLTTPGVLYKDEMYGRVPLEQTRAYGAPTAPTADWNPDDSYTYTDGSFVFKGGGWTAAKDGMLLLSRLTNNQVNVPYTGFLAYTWVTDKQRWFPKPLDRRFTRSVVVRTSQYHWYQGSTWKSESWHECVTADCSPELVQSQYDARTYAVGLRFSSGPLLKWWSLGNQSGMVAD